MPVTCWTVTSPRRHPTSVGSRTSPTAGPGPASSTSRSSSTSTPSGSWVAGRDHQGHRPGADPAADRAVGPGPTRHARSSPASCCTTPTPGRSTPRSGSPSTSSSRASRPRSGRRGCLRQRPDGIDHRPVQDRVHRHDRLPRRPLQDPRRHRVRDRRLGRLVQPPTPARLPRHGSPQSSTSRTTTLPSTASRNPYAGGTEAVTLRPATRRPPAPHRHRTNPRRNLRPAPRPDLDIAVVDATTGEILRELALDPTRDYQPTGAPKGPTRK